MIAPGVPTTWRRTRYDCVVAAVRRGLFRPQLTFARRPRRLPCEASTRHAPPHGAPHRAPRPPDDRSMTSIRRDVRAALTALVASALAFALIAALSGSSKHDN